MRHNIILTGDINLYGNSDSNDPFAHLKEKFHSADLVFSNLECCFYEGEYVALAEFHVFYVPFGTAEILRMSGIDVLGIANNVNFGATAIRSSIHQLDALGIKHTGAGKNIDEAAKPVIMESSNTRFGCIQRTSIYWPVGHEATRDNPGVATIAAHTAYRPRFEKTISMNRPGLPPEVLTWMDPLARNQFQEDIKSLRNNVDILISSHHWGLGRKILDYQSQIAHEAIDSGADIVIGHGPHFPLGIEFYNGKPIFYGLGGFCFIPKYEDRLNLDSVGLMVNLTLEDKEIIRTAFSFVRLDKNCQVIIRPLEKEEDMLKIIKKISPASTVFTVEGDEIVVKPE